MLDFLHLGLGRSTDLDDGDAAGKLGQALLELLTVEVGLGVLHLALDLSNAGVDGGLVAGTVDDGGVVLRDLDRLGAAEVVDRGVGELGAQVAHDGRGSGEGSDVLKHALATVAVARGLDGGDVQRAAQLVEDEGGQSLAVDVLSDDHERLAGTHDVLEQRHDVLNVGDLLVGHEDVGVLEVGLHALVVRGEVRRDVALVELHALDGVDVDAEGLGLLDGDDAVLANDLHGLGNLVADVGIAGGNGADGGNLLLGGDGLGDALHVLDDSLDGLVDAATDGQRVGASGDVAQALVDDDLGKQRGGGGAVTHEVVRLGGDLLHELGAHVLDVVGQLDLLGDGNAVVGDGGSAVGTLKGDVTTLGAHGDGHGIGQGVDALGELGASVGVESNLLSHCSRPPDEWVNGKGAARRRVTRRASPSYI